MIPIGLAGRPAPAKSRISVLGIGQRLRPAQYQPQKQQKDRRMYISLAASRWSGFLKWSLAHPSASNDDDHPGGITPAAVAVPRLGEPEAPPEQRHVPWLVPGVAGSL